MVWADLLVNPAPVCFLYGASTRAACWSVVRAGYQPVAADLFADLDFPPQAVVTQRNELSLADARAAFLRLTDPHSPPVFLPAGGWENLVTAKNAFAEDTFTGPAGRFASEPGAILQARNPFFWGELLQQTGCPVLPLRDQNGRVHLENSRNETSSRLWVRKPCRSAGGQRIQLLPETNRSLPAATEYDQQWQPGLACSAQFLTEQNPARTELLGCTRQIVGVGPSPFAYAGNLYPLAAFSEEFCPPEASRLQQLGTLLGSGCGLQGVWGLDFLWNGSQIFPLEINPRYTAAMELIELATQQAILSAQQPWCLNKRCLGKQILYAARSFSLPSDWDWNQTAKLLGRPEWRYGCWEIPLLSDLPRPGSPFHPGEPVCTIWSEAETAETCLQLLAERLARVSRQLAQLPAMPAESAI